MRRARPAFLAVLPCAVLCALLLAPAAGALPTATAPSSDRAVALRVSADWLAAYPARNWGGVELPGRCTPMPGGRRVCPIAIVLRAWTEGRLEPWRCGARAILPPPGSTAAPRRTSAHCEPVTDPA